MVIELVVLVGVAGAAYFLGTAKGKVEAAALKADVKKLLPELEAKVLTAAPKVKADVLAVVAKIRAKH